MCLIQGLADHFLGFFDRIGGYVLERKAAERERQTASETVVMDVGKFQRPAAKIANNSVGPVKARNDAESGELRLSLSGDDFNGRTANAFGPAYEILAIAGIPASRSRDRVGLRNLYAIAKRAKPAERRQRPVYGVGRKQAGRLDLAPEAAQYLFIENGCRTSGQAFIDDQAYRVRADVNHGNRRPVVEPSLRSGGSPAVLLSCGRAGG